MLTISNLDNELVQDIDGLMLSDGCLVKQRFGNAVYYVQVFAERYEEWALKIQDDFEEFGIESKISLEDSGREGYKRWELRTIADANKLIFPIFKDRWYNGRTNKRGWMIKTIPPNIDLSPPQSLANWYMGDGSYKKHARVSLLHTDGFTLLEIIDLCDELDKILSIKTIIHGKHIYIPSQYTLTFLDYIKDYKVNCFAYKWGE